MQEITKWIEFTSIFMKVPYIIKKDNVIEDNITLNRVGIKKSLNDTSSNSGTINATVRKLNLLTFLFVLLI